MRKVTALDVATIGIMSATLSAGKMALAFLPNIEVVSLLIIFYSIYFGRKAIAAVFVFIAAECLIWGMGLWTVMYVYVWPILTVWLWCSAKGKGRCSGRPSPEYSAWPLEDFARLYICSLEDLERPLDGG